MQELYNFPEQCCNAVINITSLQIQLESMKNGYPWHQNGYTVAHNKGGFVVYMELSLV